ncbi:MAG: SPOR domain-containing protein [Roseibium sp.]
MGTVGLASYQFGAPALKRSGFTSGLAGITLPPTGDVTSTASIKPRGTNSRIEVISMPAPSVSGSNGRLEQSQIAVLQEQIVGLRRRLSALSEQNVAYSRRIAALESGSESGGARLLPSANTRPTENQPMELEPSLAGATKKFMAPLPKPRGMIAYNQQSEKALEQPAPRRIRMHTGQQNNYAIPTLSAPEPVRIVELPKSTGEPISTGSINPESGVQLSVNFDSTPTTNVGQPKIIEPSGAAGRLHGSGQNVLKRSDFGAVVGNYASLAEAANAWEKFKEQNEERMSGLRPLISDQSFTDSGYSLLVGPFGNAADAAAVCFQLLEVTEYCHPALYAGDPLVATADFRETAFQ